MEFLFSFEVDPANKILICEAKGTASKIIQVEHMLKNIVKLAGKNQVKNVVLDVTELSLTYGSVCMAKLMMTINEESWLEDLKIARIINFGSNAHNLVGEMSEKYQLPIRNFEDRSAAMMWLLFNK